MSTELKSLMSHRNSLCVSVIAPLHQVPSDAGTDRLALQHALNEVRRKLAEMNHPHSLVMERIEQLRDQALALRGECGVGLFATSDFSQLVTFPFEVSSKVTVAGTFEIRDLVQKERYMTKYFLLALDGSGARLFTGREKQLHAISDENFPASYDGIDYEVPVPENQVDNATVPTKRAKSTTVQNKDAFFKLVEQKLNPYLAGDAPLIVAGVEKLVAEFVSRMHDPSLVKGKVFGSYSQHNMVQLCDEAWNAMRLHFRMEEHDLLHRLRDISRELVSSGISDVWYDVKQGKGQLLLVEKDYSAPGYLGEDEFSLQTVPSTDNMKHIPDAVDDLIECMLDKNGLVYLVPNGQLRNYAGVAVINRY